MTRRQMPLELRAEDPDGKKSPLLCGEGPGVRFFNVKIYNINPIL
jgi:hypothetical protein